MHALCDPVLLRDVRTAEHLGDDAQAGADAGRHIELRHATGWVGSRTALKYSNAIGYGWLRRTFTDR